jgi:hypothetical protein
MTGICACLHRESSGLAIAGDPGNPFAFKEVFGGPDFATLFTGV